MHAYKTINTLKQANEDSLNKIEYYKTQLIIRYNSIVDSNFELGEKEQQNER
jgi:hypothetical protein